MSRGFQDCLVRVAMSSSGNDMRVYEVVGNCRHRVSYYG